MRNCVYVNAIDFLSLLHFAMWIENQIYRGLSQWTCWSCVADRLLSFAILIRCWYFQLFGWPAFGLNWYTIYFYDAIKRPYTSNPKLSLGENGLLTFWRIYIKFVVRLCKLVQKEYNVPDHIIEPTYKMNEINTHRIKHTTHLYRLSFRDNKPSHMRRDETRGPSSTIIIKLA